MSLELLARRPLLESYLKKTPGDLSCLSFANIFLWRDFFEFTFEEVNDNLCVFAQDSAGEFLYLPPLGQTISDKTIEFCFERMRWRNNSGSLTRIENVSEQQLKYFSEDRHKIYKKGHEYLYCRQDLARFQSGAYKSKRNACNYFRKNFSSAYRAYEPSMKEDCQKLYDVWQKRKRLGLREEIDLALLSDSQIVHRRVWEDFGALDLVGRVVEVDGRIAAYTFGYFVGEKTFCVLLEIADKDCKGLATYIFNRLCQDPALEKVKWINVMDDFGPENVCRTKMSFRPLVLLPVYTVSEKRE